MLCLMMTVSRNEMGPSEGEAFFGEEAVDIIIREVALKTAES